MILNVETAEPLEQVPSDWVAVESGSQSTAELSLCVSVDIFVKSPDVKESVTLHIIVEP